MPVINCPDCGREVSTVAPACPNCGRPSPAGLTPIAPGAVPVLQEETLWKGSPSLMMLLGRIIFMILIVIAVPVVAHFLASRAMDIQSEANIVRIGWYLTIGVLLFEAVSLAMSVAQLRSTIYTVTNQRVMIERGLLSKSLSEIDLRYIDDTQFYQSFVQRLLGMGNVNIISSDKALPVYGLQGIGDPRGVRELIRTSAYQVSQRQIFTRAT